VKLHASAPGAANTFTGYGKGYVTPHDSESGYKIQFLPDALKGRTFYEPKEIGFEREILKRMEYYKSKREPGR
jgi:putative ATPase